LRGGKESKMHKRKVRVLLAEVGNTGQKSYRAVVNWRLKKGGKAVLHLKWAQEKVRKTPRGQPV